jgi:hypothetical protein
VFYRRPQHSDLICGLRLLKTYKNLGDAAGLTDILKKAFHAVFDPNVVESTADWVLKDAVEDPSSCCSRQ